MSELNNPLFEDRREFLERQKEEYKNALLSDVAELKDQSQTIVKQVAIAGGALLGIYFLSRAIGRSSDNSSKKKKKKGNRLENPVRFKGAEDRAWISSIPEVEDDEPLYSAIERTYPAVYHPSTGTLTAPGYTPKEETSMIKAFFKSDLFKAVEQQLAAMLMVYLTKLIEEKLSGRTQEQPVLVEEVTQVEYQIEPDQTPDVQPPQF
ncbi:hypothetical protein [Rufibacter roseus]|uniref:Uncharacterized protein n=1 Tax=Rufibacter roseus TaxID=1567108 RepID=A0ABW2DFQ1_9BACT|nr:hypothetical protein [Rufibacter roseus]